MTPAAVAAVKPGAKFLHRRWLESDYRTPATFQVTRVADGCVWFAQVNPDGTLARPSFYRPMASFLGNSVKEWI